VGDQQLQVGYERLRRKDEQGAITFHAVEGSVERVSFDTDDSLGATVFCHHDHLGIDLEKFDDVPPGGARNWLVCARKRVGADGYQ
jgi:hypothetical protein